MNLKRIFRTLVVSVLLAPLVSGCASYRMNCPAPDMNIRSVEASPEHAAHSVAVVELDDQGEFWDIAQLRGAVELLRRTSDDSPQGVLTLIFIHGWHQQARWDKGRLPWFEDQVRQAAQASVEFARVRGLPNPAPVVGVCIGWRGEVFDAPVLRHFDFWNRLLASRRVASIDMTEALASLTEATGENPQSMCILIGHSMGASILERVIEPFVASRLISEKEIIADGSLDLVVFANPSIEALYTKQLIDLMKRRKVRLMLEDVATGERIPAPGPIMVTLSAQDDPAGRIMFPAGQWFASWFTRFRDYDDPAAPSQKYLMKRTAPHTPFLSHAVQDHGPDAKDEGFTITPHPDSINDTPFWVVQVPETVMSDHGDLDSERFGDLLNWLTQRNDLRNPGTQLVVEQNLEAALREEEQARTAREAKRADLGTPIPLR